jgi:hypothetical protein
MVTNGLKSNVVKLTIPIDASKSAGLPIVIGRKVFNLASSERHANVKRP